MIGYISLLFFHVSILPCLCPRFFYFFIFVPPSRPASIPRLVPSCTHVFLTQVSLGTDECAGFREGCGFQKMSDWYSRYSQSRCQLLLIYCFQPRAVLLNRRLTNRPSHYLSLSLTGRESRVQMPRCLSARWLVVVFFFLFIFAFFTRGSVPHAVFLFSFVFFFPKVKKNKIKNNVSRKISCTVLLVCIAHTCRVTLPARANHGHKLWTVGKYAAVFLLCRQKIMRWKLFGGHPGSHRHLEKRYLASDHHSRVEWEDWKVCMSVYVGGWVIW